MNNMVFLFGLPGCGKTTLIQNVIPHLGSPHPYTCGLVRGHAYNESTTLLLGLYTNDVFSGTDKLSMAMQTSMPDFIGHMQQAPYTSWSLLGEGDRISNMAFFTQITKLGRPDVLVLDTTAHVLEQRRDHRSKQTGRGQSINWLTGRTTKLQNVLHQLRINNLANIDLKPYNTELDTKICTEWILDRLQVTEQNKSAGGIARRSFSATGQFAVQ